VLADYERIFYSQVPAIANSSSKPALFGSSGGPGFGWHDVNVYKIGAEWRANPKWTFRAGYAYSDNPIESSDVTLNILAPGVVQHHITAGASYRMSDSDTLEFSGMYVPESTVTGIEVTPSGRNPARNITLNMHQMQFLVGWTHTF
jgi:long-chain fatty acid transport protein